MTADEIRIASALCRCRFCPGTWAKSFAIQMQAIATQDPQRELSHRQQVWLLKLTIQYRRQISGQVVAVARKLLGELEESSGRPVADRDDHFFTEGTDDGRDTERVGVQRGDGSGAGADAAQGLEEESPAEARQA